MAIGGSTCGAKIGGNPYGEKIETTMNGGAKRRGVIKKKVVKRVRKGGEGYEEKLLGGAKKVVKKRRRVVKRKGGEGLVREEVERAKLVAQNAVKFMGIGGEATLSGGARKRRPRKVVLRRRVKRGGSSDDDEDNEVSGGAKKRVLHPYNKFVKKHFPKMKKENPNYTAIQIMKKLAIEWDKHKKQK
jgi:hypothetical protein